MIFTERNITIRNDSATINAPVILYRGDKNVEVRFILIESPYKYSNRDSINIFESTDASYAQLVIKTPNDREPIFGDITAVGNNNVTFVIRHDMIDEIEEVGKYDFQIRLFDADQTSMATTPEVVGGFIIKEPIAKEDSNNNITNSAIVGSAVVTNDLEIPTFVGDNYNKTAWNDGDVISRQKLNKMEDGMYETYELSKNNSSQIKDIENTKVNLQKVKELIVDAQLEGTEIDTSTFVRKSQLDNISLASGNMANVEDFLLDKKILAWDNGQNRNTCVDSVAQPGWIVFNEVECMQGDTLFLLNNTEKILGICNIFFKDGTLSRIANVSEVTGITINENEKYIRMCYNNDSNKDLYLFQIKKDTSDLNKFESFGNFPILSEEEKNNMNIKLKDLNEDLSNMLIVNIKINTTIGLYNTLTKEEQFSDNGVYVKAKMPVNGGEILYINATNLNDYNFKAYIILDSDDNIIASCEGYGNDELVKDLKVEVPVNGRMILLNSSYQNGIQVKKFTKTRIDDIENQVNANKAKIDVIETKVDAIENGSGSHSDSFNYENDIKRFTRTQLKHPFKYKTFDKAYVTFAFDDGTNDLDKIASIFKEFDYPMCMALPPDSLNTICVGLQSESNGYTVNMKVKDVAMKVIENGGEVLCHSWTPITLDNINDKELLTETFISNVKVLRNAGFEVNGIITAGGAGALDGGLEQGGDVFQYWATIEFDYSDRYGFTEDYFYPRINLGDSLDMNKTRIDDAINHNKWIVFFGHALQDSGNYTEENLRAILQYCKDRNVSVVPYKCIYNTFK